MKDKVLIPMEKIRSRLNYLIENVVTFSIVICDIDNINTKYENNIEDKAIK